MKNRNIMFATIFLALGLLAFSQVAQAVVPPPDGGYPNFTTAEGTKALFSLTTGAANTAVGWFSLFGTSSGSFILLLVLERLTSTPRTTTRPLA